MDKILILAGPSAVGKTTLAKELLSMGGFEYVRSATTRAPRGDGNDGEYIYLSVDEFIEKARSGGMLEYTEYAGNLYGTPSSEIERIYKSARTPLLVLDLDGVDSIKSEERYPSFAVYLYEDLNVLEQRLYARYLGSSPTASGLERFCERKERNIKEYMEIEELALGFDALIGNSELPKTAKAVLEAYNGGLVLNKAEAIEQIKALLDAKFNPKNEPV